MKYSWITMILTTSGMKWSKW